MSVVNSAVNTSRFRSSGKAGRFLQTLYAGRRMTVVLLRESGALGDVLNIGSVAAPLRDAGHEVHLWMFAADMLLELASMIPDIDFVHPLHVTVDRRRPRGNRCYERWPYLSPVLQQLEADESSVLVDLFCPGVTIERESARHGVVPELSRAQAFCAQIGVPPEDVAPGRLAPRDAACWSGWWGFNALLDRNPVVVCLEARSNSRSVQPDLAAEITGAVSDRFEPVIVVDIFGRSGPDAPNAIYFPRDLTDEPPGRNTLHGLMELVSRARCVVAVDSFSLHLAGTFGKPTVVLCGPTHPVPASAHYQDMVPVRPRNRPPCAGCYFQTTRGYAPECEVEGHGCIVMGSYDEEDIPQAIAEIT